MGSITDFKDSIKLYEENIDYHIENINEIIEESDEFIEFMLDENRMAITLRNLYELYIKMATCYENSSGETKETYDAISNEVALITIFLKNRFYIKVQYDEVFGYRSFKGKNEIYSLLFKNKTDKYDEVIIMHTEFLFYYSDDFPFKNLLYKKNIFMNAQEKINIMLGKVTINDFSYDGQKRMHLRRIKTDNQFKKRNNKIE